MVDSDLCHGLTHVAMSQTIYLKPEFQSAKHLVSLDAYNFFSLLQQSLKHFQNYRIQVLSAVNHINITKTHLIHAIIILLKLQGIVTSFMQFK